MFQVNNNKKILNFMADVLFPKSCYGCGCSDMYLCHECGTKVIVKDLACPHCNIRIPFGRLGTSCKSELGIDHIFISFDYKNEIVKKMIYDFKYNNCFILAEDFVKTSVYFLNKNKFLKNIFNQETIIVPVPSYPSKKRKRGFNPAEKLSIQLSKLENILMDNNFLIKTKNTKPQAKIKNVEERYLNNKDAFMCLEKDIPKNFNILLVDDVYTTGSTIRECAKALRGAGYKNISAFVIANN